MNRFFVTALIALSGCNQPSMEVAQPSISSVEYRVSTPINYCEFYLGEAIPEEMSFTSKEVFPTEGDERIFYTYKACDGRQQIKVELAENVIDSIEISDNGSCLESVACVGDAYNKVLENNPASKLYLSSMEGGAFALVIGKNVDVYFDRGGIQDFCYDVSALPAACERAIHESKVISLLLHRSPD